LFTIKKTLENAIKTLNSAGIESAELDARLLFEYATKMTRMDLICNPDLLLSERQAEEFKICIQRRCHFEPVSHIIGMREFWSLPFYVTKDVLDPRPDSETLIEAALTHFPDKKEKLKILDLGTGSGCLAITLLKEYRNAEGFAVDVSYDALKIAQKNSDLNEVQERLHLINASWMGALNTKFDLIISNPPYIPLTDKDNLQKDVQFFDPHLALFGGDDGLTSYRHIAENVRSVMNMNSVIVLELGIQQKDDVINIFKTNGFKDFSLRCDIQNIERALIVKI
jgi:release factor glutamine methyltransferase